jgi:hypothetical protein
VQLREPEHRHDGVADVLLNRAAVSFQDRPHIVEIDIQDLAERLAVEPLAQARGALQIAEDDRHRSPDLLGHGCRRKGRAADPAQAEPIRVLLTATWAGLHGRSLSTHQQRLHEVGGTRHGQAWRAAGRAEPAGGPVWPVGGAHDPGGGVRL